MWIISKVINQEREFIRQKRERWSTGKTWANFFWSDGKARIADIKEAFNSDPAQDHRSFEEIALALGVQPDSSVQTDRASKINGFLAAFFFIIASLCFVSLAEAIVYLKYLHIIGSSIVGILSLLTGTACLWRYQIFTNRKYTPFFTWIKQGGSLYIIVAMSATILFASSQPSVLTAGSNTDILLPEKIEVEKKSDISAGLMRNIISEEVWDEIAGKSGGQITTWKNPWQGLLLSVLQTLNIAASTYLSIFMLWTWGLFIVNTAHEGGKKGLGGGAYNSLWLPVKHSISVAFVAPIFHGLNLIQVIIIGGVALSINSANCVIDAFGKWYTDNVETSITTVCSNTLATEAKNVTLMMFQSSVAQTIHQRNTFPQKDRGDDPNMMPPYWTDKIPKEDGKTIKYSDMNYTVYLEDNTITLVARALERMDRNVLGSVSFPYPSEDDNSPKAALDRKLAESRIKALIELWEGMRRHGEYYLTSPGAVRTGTTVREFCIGQNRYGNQSAGESYIECSQADIQTTPHNQLVDNYVKTVSQDISETAKAYVADSKDIQKKIKESLSWNGSEITGGWLHAAMFAYSLAALQKEIDSAILSTVNYTTYGSGAFDHRAIPLKFDENRSQAGSTGKYFAEAFSNMGSYYSSQIQTDPSWSATMQGEKDGTSGLEKILRRAFEFLIMSDNDSGTHTKSVNQGILASLMSRFENQDPLVVLQAFGDRLIKAAYYIAGPGMLTSMIPGFGSISNLGLMACAAIFSCGVILAYVAPATPFLFFLRAVISWLFLVCEALVAAPFWAVMHAMPKGNGPVSDSARRGYYLLVDIICRPTLLTVGAILSMVITRGVGWLSFVLFNKFFVVQGNFIKLDLTADVINSIIYVAAMYSFVITINSKGITYFSEKVTRWLGSENGAGSLDGGEDPHTHSTRMVGAFTSSGTQLGNAAFGKIDTRTKKASGGGDTPAIPSGPSQQTYISSSEPSGGGSGSAGWSQTAKSKPKTSGLGGGATQASAASGAVAGSPAASGASGSPEMASTAQATSSSAKDAPAAAPASDTGQEQGGSDTIGSGLDQVASGTGFSKPGGSKADIWNGRRPTPKNSGLL